MKDGLPSEYVWDYFRDSHGKEYILTDSGVVTFEQGQWSPLFRGDKVVNENEPFQSMGELPDGSLWVYGPSGLYQNQVGYWLKTRQSLESPCLAISLNSQVVTNLNINQNRRAFCTLTGQAPREISPPIQSSARDIECIVQAPDGSVWAGGYNLLTRWNPGDFEWRVYKNLPHPATSDPQGRIWFSGDNQTIIKQGKTWNVADPNHSYMMTHGGDTVWGWNGDRIVRGDDGKETVFGPEQTGLHDTNWIGSSLSGETWAEGFDSFRQLTLSHYTKERGWSSITPPQLQGKRIFSRVAAQDGSAWFIARGERDHDWILGNASDETWTTISNPPGLLNLHTPYIQVDSLNNLWLFGQCGLYRRDDQTGEWTAFDQFTDQIVFGMIEYGQDDYWFAVTGPAGNQGRIVHWQNGNWTEFNADIHDFCMRWGHSALIFGGDNCLFHISEDTNWRPLRIQFPEKGSINGLEAPIENELWVNIGDRTCRYNAIKSPPETFATIADSRILRGQNAQFHFSDRRRFAPGDSIRSYVFSWSLDGGEWSEFSPQSTLQIDTDTLSIGEHTLLVKARNAEGETDGTPIALGFTVNPTPLQEIPAFRLGVLLTIFAMFGLTLLTLRSKRELNEAYQNLETIVQARTRALEENRYIMEKAQTTAKFGTWLLDCNTRRIELSSYVYELLGIKPDSFPHTLGAYLQFTHPGDREALRIAIDEACKQKTPLMMDHRLLRPDGVQLWVFEQAEISPVCDNDNCSIIGAVQNITERKINEERIRRSEQRFRSYFEIPSMGLAICSPEGRWLEVNPGLINLLGYSRQELLSSDWLAALHPEEAEKGRQAFQQALDVSGQHHFELRFQQKEGQVLYCEADLQTIGSSEGVAEYVLALIHDVSDRRKAEEEKQSLEEQLRHAQKMEAVGQLAGGIAHDFNNLMTVVNGYSELLLNQKEPDDPGAIPLKQIFEAGQRAAKLTQQLLAFSRKQLLQPERINLNQILNDMTQMLQRLITENIELEILPGDDLRAIEADPGQIQQVILNIAINARDAMPSGGAIRIRTENTFLERELRFGDFSLPPGQYVLLGISDNGEGMSEAVRSHIFEPFFTTKEVGKGTGLGLATVYGIVKQSRGAIRVYSREGIGTEFEIFFPIALNSPKPEVALSDIQHDVLGHETILVVEDEQAVRGMISDSLSSFGYTVILAQDGADAIRIARETEDEIDVIVTDVVMPRLNGPEVATRVRDAHPEARVVFMSGYAMDIIDNSTIASQDAVFLQKPFSPDQLAMVIRSALTRTPPPQESD